jgi:hypothetical protein
MNDVNENIGFVVSERYFLIDFQDLFGDEFLCAKRFCKTVTSIHD